MNRLLTILLTGVVVVSGCSTALPVDEQDTLPENEVDIEFIKDPDVLEESPLPWGDKAYGDIDINDYQIGTWGLYGSLTINNYQSGYDMFARQDRQEELFRPLYIINRVGSVTEKGILTTEPSETEAEIPIRRILHDDDIANIKVTGYKLELGDNGNLQMSDTRSNEQIRVTDYSDGNITIKGLEPDAERGVMITYAPDSEFLVKCVILPKAGEGYVEAPKRIVEWVSFDKGVYIVEPDTYMPVWVYLNVPENIKLPDKWQFWLEVSVSSGRSSSGITTQVAVKIPVQVHMAE